MQGLGRSSRLYRLHACILLAPPAACSVPEPHHGTPLPEWNPRHDALPFACRFWGRAGKPCRPSSRAHTPPLRPCGYEGRLAGYQDLPPWPLSSRTEETVSFPSSPPTASQPATTLQFGLWRCADGAFSSLTSPRPRPSPLSICFRPSL